MLLKARFVIFHDYLELVGTITNQGFNRLDLKLWELLLLGKIFLVTNSYSKVENGYILNLIILFLSKRKVKLILG
ncbi:hypothetical protein C4X99_02330 [Leptospira interrogans serovar Geyaweera]|nr:hypothetical protein C4X99_02330 [Leptospira interrogans serovar Geyaweera]